MQCDTGAAARLLTLCRPKAIVIIVAYQCEVLQTIGVQGPDTSLMRAGMLPLEAPFCCFPQWRWGFVMTNLRILFALCQLPFTLNICYTNCLASWSVTRFEAAAICRLGEHQVAKRFPARDALSQFCPSVLVFIHSFGLRFEI